jgi:hypothetical protein
VSRAWRWTFLVFAVALADFAVRIATNFTGGEACSGPSSLLSGRPASAS